MLPSIIGFLGPSVMSRCAAILEDLLNQDRCGRRDANGMPHRRNYGTGCLIAHEVLLGVACQRHLLTTNQNPGHGRSIQTSAIRSVPADQSPGRSDAPTSSPSSRPHNNTNIRRSSVSPFFAHHPHLTASCSSAQLQHTRFLQAPALLINYSRWCGCLLAPTSRQIFAPCSCLPTTTSPSSQRLNCLLFPSSAPSCPLSLLYCL
jgi:hypothetical protein